MIVPLAADEGVGAAVADETASGIARDERVVRFGALDGLEPGERVATARPVDRARSAPVPWKKIELELG
jgi:hypothetical protein